MVRWDGTQWTSLKPLTSGNNNSDFLVWEQPVYAMADGVVLDFENNQNDNPVGTKSNNANFFSIQHGSEVGDYYHLRKGSLNPALMVVGATVKAGDLLGLAGNSGISDAPHLHIQVTRNGVAMPLLFHEAYVIDRLAPNTTTAPGLAAFSAMNDQGPPWEKDLIWPSPLRRAGEAVGGAISSVSITHATQALAVTASRTAAGNLELESWDVASNGVISGLAARTTGSTIGTIRNVSVAALTKNLADELGPAGITVNCVHPGMTRTVRSADLDDPDDAARAAAIEERLPRSNSVKRMIDDADLGPLVAFLASPLSFVVNGESIEAGGGLPGTDPLLSAGIAREQNGPRQCSIVASATVLVATDPGEPHARHHRPTR